MLPDPLTPIFSPIQRALGEVLVYLRVLKSLGSWHDPQASFVMCVSLLLVSALMLPIGAVLWLVVPWAHLFGWTFRLLGIALLGPHMFCLGKYVARREAEAQKEAEAFSAMSSKEQNQLLAKEKERMLVEGREKRANELQKAGKGVREALREARELGAFPMVITETAAAAGGLRRRCRPDPAQSQAYPLEPRTSISKAGKSSGYAELPDEP